MTKLERYAAFLRGVMPTNCRMSELRKAFESAGFEDVKTVLGSGNVVFSAKAATTSALEKRAEAAMAQQLGRTFFTIVRPVDALRRLLASDPYADFRLEPGSKRVVTFVRGRVKPRLKLPAERDGARMLAAKGGEAFTAYVKSPRGPAFMGLIEEALGKDVTTRTWETVEKVAR